MNKLKERQQYLEESIRVNHAGEFGAKRIYEGQLAVLGKKPVADVIKHMKEQELEHLEYFEGEIIKRKIRPSALNPLWNVGGFLLGAATAAMGEKAAMACTVAVEEVIDEHYQEQVDILSKSNDPEDKKLQKKILKFQADELEHRDTGLQHDAEQAVAYPLLSSAIKQLSKTAIFLAKKI